MDRVPVPMPRPLRLAAALLIASVAIGCQGDSPAAPADDGSDQSENEAATTAVAEREALVALYNSTDGGNWTNNTGWLLSDDHCRWFGVFCDSGLLTRVNLDSNNLTGSIPAELGNLTTLGTLHLEENNLTGSIPAELGNLTALFNLGLHGNNLTGSIPAELGNLTALGSLHIQENNLSGPIPAELRNLPILTVLRLQENNLSGPIPAELGKLTALTLSEINLAGNQLSGLVPLPVARLGGQIPECRFYNPGLFMPDSQDYMDADLNNDGFICGIALSTPTS